MSPNPKWQSEVRRAWFRGARDRIEGATFSCNPFNTFRHGDWRRSHEDDKADAWARGYWWADRNRTPEAYRASSHESAVPR